jgi:hypothetical protein
MVTRPIKTFVFFVRKDVDDDDDEDDNGDEITYRFQRNIT